MRVALIGWEIDDLVADCLARLGTEVVAFTRWFPDREVREERGEWVKFRCPHEISESPAAEADAFREAVLRSVWDADGLRGFDVIHALDAFARPAAWGLQKHSSAAVAIGSVNLSDMQAENGLSDNFRPDRWICSQPWVAERWRGLARKGVPIEVIPTRSGLIETRERATSHEAPSVVFWVPREASLDPAGVVAAISAVREWIPNLSAIVLGDGIAAQSLRSRLSARGWIAVQSSRACESTLEHWQYWMTHGSVVAVAAPEPASDAAAFTAWLAGIPVVRIESNCASAMAGALGEALNNAARREGGVKVGAALAAQATEPSSIAQAWVRVYVDALASHGSTTDDSWPGESASVPVQTARSRLSLIAVSPRELYAAWQVRRDDWLTALEWIGLEGARASLAVRLHDVTDIRFHGDNAHGSVDVDLGPDERHRLIGLDSPGRSFAGSLGVRTPGGFFQPIAHAPLCHLPREGLAPEASPERRLGVLRRR
jgi:hypothetical protein